MSSLPDIIDKVYSFKIRNKTGTLYPVSKNSNLLLISYRFGF